MPDNVVTLTTEDIEYKQARKQLAQEGSSVFVEFYRAPGCRWADARVQDWPDDLSYEEMSIWLRSFAVEIDMIADREKVESEQAGRE